MVLTEIALLKWQRNVSLVCEDCWFAVQLSRRIGGKSRSYLKRNLFNTTRRRGTRRSRGKFHGSFTIKLKYTSEFSHTWEELCMIHLNNSRLMPDESLEYL